MRKLGSARAILRQALYPGLYQKCLLFARMVGGRGKSVECATPGKEVPGSISAVAARSLLVGSVSV